MITAKQSHSPSRALSHLTLPALDGLWPEPILLSQAGRSAGQVLLEQRAGLQLPNCLLGRSSWLEEVPQISGTNYLLDVSISLLLSSLRETLWGWRQLGWVSTRHVQYHTGNLSRTDWEEIILSQLIACSTKAPFFFSSWEAFDLNQTQMFTTHFRRTRVGSQHPSFCPSAPPLFCTKN